MIKSKTTKKTVNKTAKKKEFLMCKFGENIEIWRDEKNYILKNVDKKNVKFNHIKDLTNHLTKRVYDDIFNKRTEKDILRLVSAVEKHCIFCGHWIDSLAIKNLKLLEKQLMVKYNI